MSAGSDAASVTDVLDAIYRLRRESFRNPERVKISEPHLRYLVEKAGVVGLPEDEDGKPLPLAEPMTLYGVPVELDDSLGDRIVVE